MPEVPLWIREAQQDRINRDLNSLMRRAHRSDWLRRLLWPAAVTLAVLAGLLIAR